MTDRRPECDVYVISAVNDDGKLAAPVKVGISENANVRLGTIQTACPFRIELAYVVSCFDRNIARALEMSFHNAQKDMQAYGEWFNIEPVRAINILCVAYRSYLLCVEPNKEIRDLTLDFSGVLHAEKRWGFFVPETLQ